MLNDIRADAAVTLHLPTSILTCNCREGKAAPVQARTTPRKTLHASTSDRPVMDNCYFSSLMEIISAN